VAYGGRGGGLSGGTAGFVQVLEVLHKANFLLCGARMVVMSRDSARGIKFMCSSAVSVS